MIVVADTSPINYHIAIEQIDDRRGRREAERRKLHAIGTLGVLQLAARNGLLNLRETLSCLRATSFYITEELIDRLLAESAGKTAEE